MKGVRVVTDPGFAIRVAGEGGGTNIIFWTIFPKNSKNMKNKLD